MPLPFARTAPAVARPTFSRDFAGLKTLDHGAGPAITFTRGSNATYFNAAGALTTATTNEPRFDHNPSTGASLGLLIEESRTNIALRSEDFTTTWTVDNSGATNPVVTANYGVAPNGTTTADRIQFDKTGGAFSRIQQNLTGLTSAIYTFSVYLKTTFGGTANVGIRSFDTNLNCDVDGTWKRFSVSMSAAGTNGTPQILLWDSIAGNDETADILAWGAQVEQGAFPTSYIPTTNAAATRAADSAVVTPISSFYNQAEGTLFAEVNRPQVLKQVFFFNAIDAASPSNFISLESGAGSPATQRANMSSNIVSFANGVANTTYKMAAAYAASDLIGAQNGSLTSSISVTPATTMSRMNIGMCSDNNSALYGISQTYIRKVAYWPKRLTNTLLQQLTT